MAIGYIAGTTATEFRPWFGPASNIFAVRGFTLVTAAGLGPDAPARHSWPVRIIALLLFMTCLCYYFELAQHLNINGGPDELPHFRAAEFIDQHGRLARYPDDEAALFYSSHGTTRSFRPPLAYLTGVAAGRMAEAVGLKEKIRYRSASALFASATVVLVFLSISAATNMAGLALIAAVSLGLMPQFAFLTAYFNDDIAAIAVIALLLYALILLAVRGVSTARLILAGAAAGLVLVAKPTAWPAAIGAGLGLLCVLRRQRALTPKALTIMALASLCGGWWVLHNIVLYGFDNAFNWGIEAELAARHANLQQGVGLSFRDKGVSLGQLLTDHDDFLTDTYKSTVGNLGWLRLPMGPLQYAYYGLWFLLALAAPIVALRKQQTATYSKPVLSGLLLFGGALLFAAYVRVNLVTETQVQGRYLLPAVSFAFLLAALTLEALWTSRPLQPLAAKLPSWGQASMIGVLLLVPLYIHLKGFVHYVIPFYNMDYYYRVSEDDYVPWRFGKQAITDTNNLDLRFGRGGAIHFQGAGLDPWAVIDGGLAGAFDGNVLVRFTIESKINGNFALYWDNGNGFAERRVARNHYNIGWQHRYLQFRCENPRRIRLDMVEGQQAVILYGIAIAHLQRDHLTVKTFLWDRLRAWWPVQDNAVPQPA